MNKKEYRKNWYLKNRQEVLANARIYYQNNKDRIKKRVSKWRHNNWKYWYAKEKLRIKSNLDIVHANSDRWRKKNYDRIKIESKLYAKIYRKKYPEKRAALQRARVFIKQKAMPQWIDYKLLLPFYQEAKRKTIETGIPHEVDHIWPLQGKGFVGLHVPWNLQVITASENAKKKNYRPKVFI